MIISIGWIAMKCDTHNSGPTVITSDVLTFPLAHGQFFKFVSYSALWPNTGKTNISISLSCTPILVLISKCSMLT